MKKVIVIGLSGLGKSTLSKKIANHCRLHHIELDSIFWLKGWHKSTDEDFLRKLNTELDDSINGWVVDGFYGQKQGERPFEEADTIIYLDIPLVKSVYRLLLRGTSRILRRQRLWGKCQETPMGLLKLSTLVVKWRPGLQQKMSSIRNDPRYQHIDFHKFISNREADAWLSRLE